MSSAFGHALVSISLGSALKKKLFNWKVILLGMVCTILPDADVISFSFGIPYDSFWGHRGFTHSFLFTLITGVIISIIFFRLNFKRYTAYLYILYFSICTASHSLLDTLTSGGLGVAFFSPWHNERYFLPWRPIRVSPIGVENFIGERARIVLESEALWIGIPSLILIIFSLVIKRLKR